MSQEVKKKNKKKKQKEQRNEWVNAPSGISLSLLLPLWLSLSPITAPLSI